MFLVSPHYYDRLQINKFTKNLRGFQNLGGLATNIFLKVYIRTKACSFEIMRDRLKEKDYQLI